MVARHTKSNTEQFDFVTRYFLRRLALARREHGAARPMVPHREAKVDAILVFVAMPAIALISCAGIVSLHWMSPAQISGVHLPPKLEFAVVLWAVLAIVGNLLFSRRFVRFLDDPSPSFSFDTERDCHIARWQKGIAIVSAGVIVPVLSFLTLYLIA